MITPILTVELCFEQDIVLARQRARQIASLLGFNPQEQTRIATAVSEVARNAFNYASGGRVEFLVEGQSSQVFLTRVSSIEGGIADLQTVWDEQYSSNNAMGLGVVGARRLMDEVQVESVPHRGTTVQLIKKFGKHVPPLTKPELLQLVNHLARQVPQNPFTEIQQQNQELLRTLDELRQRQEELAQLNQELEDTNRGVVALYAELNDKAESLQRASELKSRFLSNMSHEFRTPLNAILSLSEMLLNRLDGELTLEQEKQVTFIRKSAESLSELVNDLLDLAKVEAGKVTVRVAPLEVETLFSTLRGMLRPLLAGNPAVILVFEDPVGIPTLQTDEGKVSQILRNFIANALKFTEKGEVRVTARMATDQTIIFSVADTGIGIAPEDQTRIFEEFVQVENPLQKKVKGTGLGLPLCKRLAELLGGQVGVQSTLGRGSTFFATLPIVYSPAIEVDGLDNSPSVENTTEKFTPSNSAVKVLIVDDEEVSRYTIRSLLAEIDCSVIEAVDGYEGLYRARIEQPQAILLDLLMPGLSGFAVVEQLKSDPATRAIPVIIITSKSLDAADYQKLANSTVAILSKHSESWQQAIAQLQEALAKAGLDLRDEG
ncbi:MAG TPA: histidine kinase [Cyanobacteria bacterium UBA9273]|nr:histidine kinase [Cyanobacteria bacterium UBA9273]